MIFHKLGLDIITPQPSDTPFSGIKGVPKEAREGIKLPHHSSCMRFGTTEMHVSLKEQVLAFNSNL